MKTPDDKLHVEVSIGRSAFRSDGASPAVIQVTTTFIVAAVIVVVVMAAVVWKLG